MKDVVQSRIQSFPKTCSEKAQEGTMHCQVTQGFWENNFCWSSVLVRPLNTDHNFLKLFVCLFTAFWNFTSLCQSLCEPQRIRTHHLRSTAGKIPILVMCLKNTEEYFPQIYCNTGNKQLRAVQVHHTYWWQHCASSVRKMVWGPPPCSRTLLIQPSPRSFGHRGCCCLVQ